MDPNGASSPQTSLGDDATIKHLATVLTATPSLRAKFFANPTGEIGKRLPPRRYWNYGPRTNLPLWHWQRVLPERRERRKRRATLAEEIFREIAKQVDEKKLSATVNTDAVFEDFFAPIVKVSQRSFNSVFRMSWAAFIAGVGLLVAAVYIAIESPTSTNSTVVASVFGGSGAISTLGAVYAMAKQGIREATLDHARLRVVLTAFATELGQLRAIAESPDLQAPTRDLDLVEQLNEAIGRSMAGALGLIPSPAESAADSAMSARRAEQDALGTKSQTSRRSTGNRVKRAARAIRSFRARRR